jgi:site-specific DNA recombinase
MKRAALYGRYSTDMQNDRSVDDQFEVARALAARDGMSVVARYEDRALSGATMHGRTGVLQLLNDAKLGRFDVVIVETMSRLGRNQKDRADIREQLEFLGISIMTPSDGVVSPLVDGIRAVIDSQQLVDMKVMIRRGMAAVVRSGRVAGGLAYGYRVVRQLDERGELVRGLREVDPDEAEIVRRIMREYLEGITPRLIAAGLNRDGIPPPRGRRWNASTINGYGKRGTGILHNEAYAGRIVWNRNQMRRSPYNGKRVGRPNGAGDRQVSEAPHLAIVDPETWEAVQARKASKSSDRPEQSRRPVHLLSSLLRCGRCGSGMPVKDRDRNGKIRVQCSAVRESASCDARAVYLPAVEAAVVEGMREQLRDPRLIEAYVRRYNQQRRQLAISVDRDRGKLEARLAAATREHERLLRAYVKGFLGEADAEAQIRPLAAEKERLAAQLASAGEETRVVALHPGLISRYTKEVDELAETLADHAAEGGAPADRLVASFRALVETVTVFPGPARAGFEVEVKGRLAELLGPEAFPTGRFGGNDGSGGGTRTPDTRIMIPLL